MDNGTDKDHVPKRRNVKQISISAQEHSTIFHTPDTVYSLSYVFAYFIAFPSISTPSFSLYSFRITLDRDVSETFKIAS